MRKYLCLVCLKELSSKKTVLNHLKNVHGEINSDSFTEFDSEVSSRDDSVSDHVPQLNVSSPNPDNNDAGQDSTLVDYGSDNLASVNLDGLFYDSLSQFGDMNQLIDQELSDMTDRDIPDITLDQNVEIASPSTPSPAVKKMRKGGKRGKGGKKKSDSKGFAYFKMSPNCFDDPNLMEPFDLYKRTKQKTPDENENHIQQAPCHEKPNSDSQNERGPPSNQVPLDSVEVEELNTDSLNDQSDSHPRSSPSNPINIEDLSNNCPRLPIDSDSLQTVPEKIPRTTFKPPYKQSKNSVCDSDDCQFCTVKKDCGQCVFCLNKIKM